MWNRYEQTAVFEKPWLLRFFDQIRFYPVSESELVQIRQDFPRGRYPLRIEESRFNLAEYERFLADNEQDIAQSTERRDAAFQRELQDWIETGAINFSVADEEDDSSAGTALDEGCVAIESGVAGNVWQLCVTEGDSVEAGQAVCLLESMKMEIEIVAPEAGTVRTILRHPGAQVHAGQCLMILEQAPVAAPKESRHD